MTASILWTFAALGAALFCLVRGVVDLRRRNYAWGALGVISAAIFLLAPVQTHSVRVTLPQASSR